MKCGFGPRSPTIMTTWAHNNDHPGQTNKNQEQEASHCSRCPNLEVTVPSRCHLLCIRSRCISTHSQEERLYKLEENCKRRVLATSLHDTYQPLSPVMPLAGRIPRRNNLQRTKEIAQSVKCLLHKHERPYFHLQNSCQERECQHWGGRNRQIP